MSGKRIAVVGLYSIPNMGDRILCEATAYLIKSISSDAEIVALDACPVKRSFFHGADNIKYRVSRKLEIHGRKKFTYEDGSEYRYKYERRYWRLRLYSYYKRTLKDVDAIVFAGGGFVKFRTQGLNYYVEMVADIAAKNNIPIMMNGIGIEGYDDSDARCRHLKEYLNSGLFKVITTRDDLKILTEDYIENKQIVTDRVGDPALWSPECYGIKREVSENSPVGINVIRGGVFKDYGNNLGHEELLEFFCDLIKELDSRGISWQIFTNGMRKDQKMGERIIERLQLDAEGRLLPAPETSEDLLNIERRMKCVFGARLHACITSYSMDVPVTGFIWNEKTRMFASLIGKPQNFFEEDELDVVRIADCIERIQTEQYDDSIRERDKKKTEKYLRAFIEEYV